MNVSLRWLEEFLRRALEPKEVAERLAMLGAPVDAIEPLHTDLGDIVVGLVEEVRPHPNADRLRVCSVDDGAGRHNVVCGAPNVKAGHRYPFARIGATLPGGLRIEERALRGETSQGMLCSARELGLGQEHDGLLELSTAAPPGTPLLKALPLADHRLVVDVGPNRPDLLCHKGIARELSSSYGVPFRLPVIPRAAPVDIPPARKGGASADTGGIEIIIEDAGSCPRFHGALLRNVRVGPSPDWLRRRLETVGVRSISNVVDATNWVMLELNQPMHAYDAAKIRGGRLIVRRALAAERLVTLDEVERTLTPEMVAIADAEGVIGLGGVRREEGSHTRSVHRAGGGIRRCRERLGHNLLLTGDRRAGVVRGRRGRVPSWPVCRGGQQVRELHAAEPRQRVGAVHARAFGVEIGAA